MAKYNNIWLYFGFDGSRKTKKLKRLVGKEGAYCFLMLMLYAGETRPDGILTGLSKEDIAEESGWVNDHHFETMNEKEIEAHIDRYIKALVSSKHVALDKESGVYSIPSFAKRQPHIQPDYKKKKSDDASNAGNSYWGKMSVDPDTCPWTERSGKFINVLIKKLPSHIVLYGTTYHKQEHWTEMFWNQDEKEKNRLNNAIRRHTKECANKSCKKLHINDIDDTCNRCQGK